MMSTKRQGVPEFEKADLDEPIFVLRAQDVSAPVLVELYALHATTLHVDHRKVDAVRRCAVEMRKWQALHGAKLPD